LPPERVAEDARKLEEQGYKEIVITGIEISSYGKDMETQESKGTLLSAIQTIHAAAPNVRLRLGSLSPAIISDEFCLELSKIPNLCNHFHLSLQSGCDATLERMGRKYAAVQVLKSIEMIRSRFKDCAVTADLIVGFPGETEAEFNQTLEFIKKAVFSDMHIFPYSIRKGTKAADMPDQVEKSVKKERARAAAGIAAEMAYEFKHAQIGKITEVLFEKEKNGISTGHTSNYLEIGIKGKIERNTVEKVEIISIKNGKLHGEMI